MKHYSIKLPLIILMYLIGSKVFAHDIEVLNSDGVYIYYKFQNNKTELAVTYRGKNAWEYSAEYINDIVIPESVMYNGTNYPVTSIGGGAFSDCSGLTSVTIPNSVTSIDGAAFYGCI